MKTFQCITMGALAFAAAGISLQAELADEKYAPLEAALAVELQERIAQARDASFWVEEYGKVLEDPEVDADEKLALRKTHILEQARAGKMGREAVAIRSAIRSLNSMPAGSGPSLDQLKDAYEGLDELGSQGQDAWDQLVADRDESVDSLRQEFAEALAEAERRHYELRTEERATQLLLDAIDHRRISATDEEFRVALKLPSIKSAAEFGFGFAIDPEDRSAQAQTTLIALVGYSQFFWDYHSGARERMGEGEQPADRDRNIFGVADGDLLGSEAIESNERLNYFLSTAAKEEFNRRIRTIWGGRGKIAVSRWNEERAGDFQAACEGLATGTDKAPAPSRVPFELLDQIDAMIGEELAAVRVIQEVRVKYESRLVEAARLGDRAALSSAHYKAKIWAKDSGRSMASYQAAQRVLDQELAACSAGDWEPKAGGITAAAKIISKTHDRFRAMVAVKRELAVLLE